MSCSDYIPHSTTSVKSSIIMMNTTKNIARKIALMAITGLALATTAAHATVTYTSGDLLLGFRSSDSGVTTSVVVNLGNAGFFRDQTTDILSLSIGSINDDLTTAFGAGWATDPNLYWGAAMGVSQSLGINGDSLNTLYATRPEAVFGTVGTAFNRASSSTQATPRNAINSAGSVFNSFALAGATAGANNNVIIEDNNTGSLDWAAFNPGVTSFGYGTFGNIQGNSATGITDTALDLFRATPGAGAGSYEGTFTIDSLGFISYGANGVAAVPEPSRAILLAAGIFSIVFRRRRSIKIAA